MIVESELVLPGEVIEMLAPYSPHRIAVRLDLDPHTASCFSIEAVRHLEPQELAELQPQYAVTRMRAMFVRVRNDASTSRKFRAQITLGPDTATAQAQLEQVLERWKRKQRDAKTN